MMKSMSMGKTSEKCTCNPAYALVAVALLAVGAFLFVRGFGLQLNGADWNPVLGWYFAGILLGSVGKILKMKAGACCPAHGMGMCCQ